MEEFKSGRGGKRIPGIGKKIGRPKVKHKKVSGSISLYPDDWVRLKNIDRNKSRAVETLLEDYFKAVSVEGDDSLTIEPEDDDSVITEPCDNCGCLNATKRKLTGYMCMECAAVKGNLADVKV